jgi:hypothetical protein
MVTEKILIRAQSSFSEFSQISGNIPPRYSAQMDYIPSPQLNPTPAQLPPPIQQILLPELLSLVHEGLEAGQGVGLFLTIVCHVEDGEVVVLLPIPLQDCADYCPRHAGEGHDVDYSATPRMGKIGGATDAQDRLSLKGIVEIGPCLFQDRFYRWFMEVSEISPEDLRQAMLVLSLVVIREEDFQEVGEALVPQAVSLPHGVDVEDPFRNRRKPSLAPELFDLWDHILVGEPVGTNVNLSDDPDHGPCSWCLHCNPIELIPGLLQGLL